MKKHPKNDYGKCHKCGGKMSPGLAIVPTVITFIDLGMRYDATNYHGGPGRLIKVAKCEKCGRSETI